MCNDTNLTCSSTLAVFQYFEKIRQWHVQAFVHQTKLVLSLIEYLPFCFLSRWNVLLFLEVFALQRTCHNSCWRMYRWNWKMYLPISWFRNIDITGAKGEGIQTPQTNTLSKKRYWDLDNHEPYFRARHFVTGYETHVEIPKVKNQERWKPF